MSEPVPRPRFGAYDLLRRIGEGGMGEVFLAEGPSPLGGVERAAVKVLLPSASRDEALVKMFMDEAAIMAQIHHPNVLAVFDFGRHDDGRYYLAMECLEGRSLARLIVEAQGRGGVSAEVAAVIHADAARGLHAAHTAVGRSGKPLQVVHRDVSPQNVFVTYDGVAKVLDFGIARASERLSRTATGIFKGKAAYMAPEQIDGQPADARSDVFALGVCLWETLAGARLFVRDHQVATMKAVLESPAGSPTAVAGAEDPELDAIVLRALEKDASARYPTAAAFERALIGWTSARRPPAGHAAVALRMRGLFEAELLGERAALAELGGEGEDPAADTMLDLAVFLPGAAPSEALSFAGDAADLEALDEVLGRADAIHGAVAQLAAELPATPAAPTPPPRPAATPSKRRPPLPVWVWVLGAVALAVGLAVGLATLMPRAPAVEAIPVDGR